METARRYVDTGALGGARNAVHMDVSTQANLRPRPEVGTSYSDDEYTSAHGRSRVSAVWDSGRRYLSRVTSAPRSSSGEVCGTLYSRQDFMEQYCVTPHQLRSVAPSNHTHHSSSIFGCLSSNNHQSSVCNRSGLLLSCVGRQSTAAEDMAQYWPQKPPRNNLPPPPPPPGSAPYGQGGSGRRGRYQWVPEEAEEAYHSLERPRPIPLAGFESLSAHAHQPVKAQTSGGGRGALSITEEQLRQAEARMRGHNHTEPNTPLSARRGHALDLEDGRRGSKHVSFMESRSPLVRSQTTSSFEEAAHAGGFTGPGARWRLAAARSQERLIDGAMSRTPRRQIAAPQQQQTSVESDDSVAAKAILMEKIKRATMKTQATQTEPIAVKPPRERRSHHHGTSHHSHHPGYLSLSPRSMHRSLQNHVTPPSRTRLMKSYSATAGGSCGVVQSQSSAPSEVSGGSSLWDTHHAAMWDTSEDELEERQPVLRPQSAAAATRTQRYKEIFIDFEPQPSPAVEQPQAVQQQQGSPRGAKRPLHKTLSEGEILLERRRIQKSDYIERQQCEAAATTESAELYSRHFDPSSPVHSPMGSHRELMQGHEHIQHTEGSSGGHDGASAGSLVSSSSLLDEEEFHENLLMREGLFCTGRRLSLDGRRTVDTTSLSDERSLDEADVVRPRSQPATQEAHLSSQGLLLLPSEARRGGGGSSCDSLSAAHLGTSSQGSQWGESQATVVAAVMDEMISEHPGTSSAAQRRALLLLAHQQQRSSADTEGLAEEEDEPTLRAELPTSQPSSVCRRSPQLASPSPVHGSKFATSPPPPGILRPPGTDVSETSEDYVTATDNSDSSSLRRRGQLPPPSRSASDPYTSSSGADVKQASSCSTAGGSSFESASSMQSSTAKDEQIAEAPVSPVPAMLPSPPPPIEPRIQTAPSSERLATTTPSSPSVASSSSSGSYSLHGSSAEIETETQGEDTIKTIPQEPRLQEARVAGWSEEERARAKRGFKLELAASPDSSPCSSVVPVGVPIGVSPMQTVQASKPPRRKPPQRHPPDGEVTPGMVRSPAMHQGFRPEDWVVHRVSPAATPASQVTALPVQAESGKQPAGIVSPNAEYSTRQGGISPCSRRLSAQLAAQQRRDSSSSSSGADDVSRRTPSPAAAAGRSPTGSRTLPRASPRRRTPARSPTATLQRPRRRSASEDLKTLQSAGQSGLPAVTCTASSVRRKSAPRIHSPSRDADGNVVQPGMLLSPHHPHQHKSGRKSTSNKTSPDHGVQHVVTGAAKALSAESLRSVSPGSDSVFYDPCGSADPSPRSAATDSEPVKTKVQQQSQPEGNGTDTFIVQPPAGFADSPEGPSKSGKEKSRLYKKADKRRFRSEERCGHQHHGTSTVVIASSAAKVVSSSEPQKRHRTCRHNNPRAKSEERRQHSGDDNRRQHQQSIMHSRAQSASSRSAQSSLELLRATGSSPNINVEQDEEIAGGVLFSEAFRTGQWLYISSRDERLVWRRSAPFTPAGTPPSSPDSSTASERDFRRRYQAVTHRMVHRRASAEMFSRLATRNFESDQTVTVRRGDGEFGFRIHGSRPVVVSAIEPATPAESSGLEVGDIVISVNGVNVLDASHSEVVKLAHAGSEVLQLEVASTRHVLGETGDVTLDDDTEDEGPAASVERCGHLMKRSPASGKWLKRWFVLRADGCLYCYKSPALESRPLGALCLAQYEVTSPDTGNMSSDPVAEPRWLLRLAREGALALTLAADSQGERDDWVSTLHAAASCPLKWEERLAQGGRLALAPVDISHPDCFGFLHKLGRRWRAWTRLYCVLKDACLFLFAAPDSPRASGLLCLHGYRIQSASAGGKRFAFDALAADPKQRHYYFHADSELDKKRWMAALEYSIDRWLKIA